MIERECDRPFCDLGEKADRTLGKKGDSLRDSYARAHFGKKGADNCAMPKILLDCFEVLRYRLQIDVMVGSQYFK